MPEHLDPRISPIFRGRPKHERFIAHALLAICKFGGKLDEVIEGFEEKEADWSEQMFVHNGRMQTLLDFNGKNVWSLRREGLSEEQIEKVKKAFAKRDMEFPEGTPPPAPRPHVAPEPQPIVDAVSEPAVEAAPQGEPTFAGKPLSELAGKSDKDLLAIEGISKATIRLIREAEKTKEQAA